MRRPRRTDHRRRVAPGREHDALVGVLVVGHEQRGGAGPVGLDDVEVVVVVAELPGLRLRRLGRGVEGRRTRQDRVAPAQDRVPAVAGRHGHVVDGRTDGCDGGEGQLARPTRPTRARGAAGRGGRARRGERRQGGDGQAGADDRAPAQHGGGDVAEVGGLGRVGHLLEAGVATAEVAGHGAAAAVRLTGHRQQRAGGARAVGHGRDSGGLRSDGQPDSSHPGGPPRDRRVDVR